MALPYTSAQKATIDAGWFALQRAVETNSLQETRLKNIFKSEKKEFGATSAKALVIEMVLRGMSPIGPATISNLALERDEKVIGFMIGVFLSGHLDNATPCIDAMLAARAAWNEAHQTYLKGL